jgi:hypothetical protein
MQCVITSGELKSSQLLCYEETFAKKIYCLWEHKGKELQFI